MSNPTSATPTKDPQTWVFPPPGAPTPPVAATSNFGPIFLGDSMVLDWSPTVLAKVRLTCFTTNSNAQSLRQDLGDHTPPWTYTFSSEDFAKVAANETFCHYWFDPSSVGNTVVWEVRKGKAPNGRTTTWSAPTTATTTSGSSRPASTSATSAGGDRSSSTASSATQSPDSNSSGSSNTGVKVGVGVGVGVAGLVAILVLLLLLLRRRRRRTTSSVNRSTLLPSKEPVVYGSTVDPVYELPGENQTQELQGSKVQR